MTTMAGNISSSKPGSPGVPSPFDGITLTELDTKTLKLMPETARTIYRGTAVALVEGRTSINLNGYYYLFAAQGGTVLPTEVVARSKTLEADSFETEPGDVFLTNVDTPDSYIQKQGHGALVSTPEGEWYASLCARPWNRPGNPSTTRAAGQPSAGKPRSRKCTGTTRAGRVLKAVTAGKPSSKGRKTPSSPKAPAIIASRMTYLASARPELEYPAGAVYGQNGHHRRRQINLNRPGSLANTHDLSLIARRWQAFYFDAAVKVKFEPFSYQQMAGLTNYYNDRHWSFVFLTE